MDSLDAKLILYIQNHCRKPFLDPIMIFITNFGNAVPCMGNYLFGAQAAHRKDARLPCGPRPGRNHTGAERQGISVGACGDGICGSIRDLISFAGWLWDSGDGICTAHGLFQNVRWGPLSERCAWRAPDRPYMCRDFKIDRSSNNLSSYFSHNGRYPLAGGYRPFSLLKGLSQWGKTPASTNGG